MRRTRWCILGCIFLGDKLPGDASGASDIVDFEKASLDQMVGCAE
jgi:hypothetical protein